MASYNVVAAKGRDFLSKLHSEHASLQEAMDTAMPLFVSGEFARVSIWRVDGDKEEVWLRSYVMTENATDQDTTGEKK